MYLKDLKIVELASVLAGPLVGRFFAEHGAEVIKVENANRGGDVTRQWRVEGEPPKSISAYYASANFGKKSVLLDLKSSADYEKLCEIIKESDVLITNFLPKVAKRLKLSIEDIRRINPKLVVGEILSDPQDPNRPGFDMVMQAQCGYLHMTGFPDRPYAKMPVAMIDILAAHQLKAGLLTALLEQQTDANFKHVRVYLMHAAFSALVNQASAYLMYDKLPQPMGSQHPSIFPYGEVYYSKDNIPFILAIGSDQQFETLIETFYIKLDAKYKMNSDRVLHRGDLFSILASNFVEIDFKEIENKLSQSKLPFTKVNSLEDLKNSGYLKGLIDSEKIEDVDCKSMRTSVFELYS